MIQLKEKLTKYITEHPVDFGTSDAETILDFLYGAYAEAHESDPPKRKHSLPSLGSIWNSFHWQPITLCSSLLSSSVLNMSAEGSWRAFVGECRSLPKQEKEG